MKRSWRFCQVLAAGLLALPAVAAAAWRTEGPFVATITDVAVDPAKPETIYAATSGGGVWRSDDGGQTWSLPGAGMVSRSVEWIEVDPRDPVTLWAGVKGDESAAFWRSPDRGKSWTSVRVDKTSGALGQPIAFAASKPGTIFVPATNLHYRSGDGGKTWQSFRVPDQDVYAFAVHPQDANIVWAGGRGSEHNLSRSQDGGKTWRPFGQGLRQDSIKLLRVSAANPSTLYAVSGFGHLQRSTDGGATWTELELGLRGTDELYSLEIDPHDPQTLLAATRKGLRVSGDAGETWRSAGAGFGNYLCMGLAFHPAKKGTVYAGAAGDGFYRSADGGQTFEAFGKGMAAGWVERLYAPPTGTGPVFAQLGVGLFRMDGPGAWTEIQEPFKSGEPAKIDGIVFDRESPKKVYAHHASSWLRSEDGGRSLSKVEVKGPSMSDMMKGRLTEPQFSSLVQDPADSEDVLLRQLVEQRPGDRRLQDERRRQEVAARGDRNHELERGAPPVGGPRHGVRGLRQGRPLPHDRRRQELEPRPPRRDAGPRRRSEPARTDLRRHEAGPLPKHRRRRDLEPGGAGPRRGRRRGRGRREGRAGVRRHVPRRLPEHGRRRDLEGPERRSREHRRPRARDRRRQPGTALRWGSPAAASSRPSCRERAVRSPAA